MTQCRVKAATGHRIRLRVKGNVCISILLIPLEEGRYTPLLPRTAFNLAMYKTIHFQTAYAGDKGSLENDAPRKVKKAESVTFPIKVLLYSVSYRCTHESPLFLHFSLPRANLTPQFGQ